MAERQQFVLPPITDPSVLAEIDRLAHVSYRYKRTYFIASELFVQ